MAGLASTASAGHHYHYHYPAYFYSHAHVYFAPVYVAPVHVAPVVVHRPPDVVLSPVYYQSTPMSYRPARHCFFSHGYRPHRGEVEGEIEWKRNGYEIEYDG